MAMVMTIVMVSCSDDDNDKKDEPVLEETYSIVGEWLEDSSDESMVAMAATRYDEDGTFVAWQAIVSPEINLYYDFDGVYSYTGSNYLDESYTSPLTDGHTTDRYEIMYVDKYNLLTKYSQQSIVTELHKIIDTYEMSSGESRSIIVDDSDFIVTKYTSTNPHTAMVDSDGTIYAKRRGMAFITASSDLGEAVVRVIVNDEDNPIENYLEWIGRSIFETEIDYGTNYLDVIGSPMSDRRYNMLDDIIESVVFSYAIQKIRVITVTLRVSADLQALADTFDKKYTNLSTAKTLRRYMVDYEGSTYVIFFDLNNSYILYMPYVEATEPEPGQFTDAEYRQFEGLVNKPVVDVAKSLDYTMTSEDWENGDFTMSISDNNLFDSVNVLFDETEDPHIVGTVYMRCKSGIEQEDIEDWYMNHYDITGDEKNPYSTEGGSVYISFKKSGSRLNVYYRNYRVNK